MKNPAQVRRRRQKKQQQSQACRTCRNKTKIQALKFKMALEIQTKAGKWKVDLKLKVGLTYISLS